MKTNKLIKQWSLIISQKSTQYLVYRINKQVERIFFNQAMKHKDIISLSNEVLNWIPTKLEVKAYEYLRIKFNDLFYTLNLL